MEKKPVYVDYQQLFSKKASRTRRAALRENAQYMVTDGYIKMGTGFPNPDMFPIVEADFKLQDGSVVHVGKEALHKHLQYGVSEGYPDLRNWLIDFQCRVHSPPTLQDPQHPGLFDMIITSGATDGIYTVLNAIANEGDWVLVEEITYCSARDAIRNMGANTQGIPIDVEGVVVEDLKRVLTSWGDAHPGTRKPRAIYLIPSCGNPTGITMSLRRKRQVYELAREHDLIIVEDDPYYFLDFNRPPIPSFLSMDVDGRVVRLDSVSKVMAPGLRVGTASGPKPLLQKMRELKDTSTYTTSGLAQVASAQVLRHWGYEGYLRHLDSVMEFYKQKMDVAVRCAKRHLTGVAEWSEPSGGMFLWLKVLGVSDSTPVVDGALQEGVLVLQGQLFVLGGAQSPYLRVCVSLITEDTCDQAFSKLADVIRSVQTAGK